MLNAGVEILFWLILISYVGARIIQTKKGFKKQY